MAGSILPGTFVMPVYRNPDDLQSIVDEVAEARGVTAYPINTGLVEDGTDLGAGAYNTLEKPRVAVAAGQSGGSFGEVWNFFDQGYPFFEYTNIDASRLGQTDLEDYNVLIFGGNLGSTLNEAGVESLRAWIQGGGTVITYGGGVQFMGPDGAALTNTTSWRSSDSEEEEDEDLPAVEARQNAGGTGAGVHGESGAGWVCTRSCWIRTIGWRSGCRRRWLS